MKKFVYLFGFVIVLLTLKAFYLDEYIEKNYGDKNVTEANATAVVPVIAPESENRPVETPEPKKEPEKSVAETNQTTETKPTSNNWSSHDKMPLDKLGDNIADRIKL